MASCNCIKNSRHRRAAVALRRGRQRCGERHDVRMGTEACVLLHIPNSELTLFVDLTALFSTTIFQGNFGLSPDGMHAFRIQDTRNQRHLCTFSSSEVTQTCDSHLFLMKIV